MMLGLTLPDAIAFGSLCAAFLAAFAGMLRGERGRKNSDVPSDRRVGMQRRETLAGLTAAVSELAAAIRAATSADAARDQYTDMIHAVMRYVDDRENNNER